MKTQSPINTRGIEVTDLEIEEIEIKDVEAYQKPSKANKARKSGLRYHNLPRSRMVA